MTTPSGIHAAEIRSLLFPTTAPTRLLQSAKALMAALPLIAQALVDRVGHKVRVVRTHDRTAMTDGTTIAITDVALPTSNTDEAQYLYYVAMKLGLLFHELGHVNETDFSLRGSRDRLTAYLTNLIEDVRQEVEFCKKVKTGRQHLRALAYAMVDLGIDTPVTDQDDATAAFTGYLYYRLRAEFAGEAAYVPLMQGAEQHLRRHFNEAFVIRMSALIGRVPGLRSTQDSMDLADDFRALVVDEIKALQKQQKKLQQQAKNASSSSSPSSPSSGTPSNGAPGQDDSDGGDASGAPEPNDASAPAGASQGQPQTGSQDADGAGQGAGSGNTAGTASASSPGDDSDLQALADAIAALQALRDAQGLQGNGSRDQRLAEQLDDTQTAMQAAGQVELIDPETASVTEANDETALTRNVHAGLEVDLTSAQSVVGPLRARLANRLHADSHTKTGLSPRGTKIDPKRLVRAGMNDPRIFQTFQEGVTIDTAILLLADVSGSMSGSKIAVAVQALFAAAAAMETLPGVEIAVAAFPGAQLVLPFGQRVRHAEPRFKLHASGGTPMAEGIRMASRLLQRRLEPRKLLFVLTDGEPNCHATARAAILGAQHIGIEAFGIGIQCNSVERLFEHNTVIHQVAELPEKMLSLIDTQLYRKSA